MDVTDAARAKDGLVSAQPYCIVIIGAGFCGSLLASELLASSPAQPLELRLIDRVGFARGAAYARREYPYLLNVPAARMSADERDGGAFLRFARERLPRARGEDFLPRELYGEYLQDRLVRAERQASPAISFERRRGEVIALERLHRTRRWSLHFSDGVRSEADTVVLASGNGAPAPLPGAAALVGSSAYVADPWGAELTWRGEENVLLVGSGLTMVDQVLCASAAGTPRMRFHALSRRGLLPEPLRPLSGSGSAEDTQHLLHAAAHSLLQLWRAVRAQARTAQRDGGEWRDVVAQVRHLAPELWQRLSVYERRRFLRHARPYWDVHRHRLPESNWSSLQKLRRSGQLQVHAGRLLMLERVGARIRAIWQPRGAGSCQQQLFERVINCTGPDFSVRRSPDRLLRSLLAQGIAAADPLDCGLSTAPHGAVVGADARAAENLYYLGPLLRAAHWESTAVAELRTHARQLGQHLLARLPRWSRPCHAGMRSEAIGVGAGA
jgi:uncharacterized NAD(P)/FAD-binding protein YdhS